MAERRLIPLLGVVDKTLFLAARSEHYWVALVCLAAAHAGGLWLSACKAVWCAIWFWAATSKLNSHFPSVIMVMMTNGPFFPGWLKKGLFAAYPDDLRPSRMAASMAHSGTAVEYSIGFMLLLVAGHPTLTAIMLVVMTCFHGFIAINSRAACRSSGHPDDLRRHLPVRRASEAGLTALASMPLLVAFLAFGWSPCRSTATSFRPASRSCSRCATTQATGRTTSGSFAKAAPTSSRSS